MHGLRKRVTSGFGTIVNVHISETRHQFLSYKTMNTRLVYLCGPIHGLNDQDCRFWRNKAKELLGAKNIMCVDPMSNDNRGREGKFGSQLVELDKKWIMSCDTILANCWTPSYGTAMEVHFAWQQHKKVVVVTNHTSPWLHYHSSIIVPTIEDAIDQLNYPESEFI